MINWTKKLKLHFTDKKFILSFLLAFLLLATSLIINYYAGTYATEKASNSVTDIILSNIPVFNVNGIFTYGSIVFWIFMILICLYNPKRIPFTVKSMAVFIIIRSIFIVLTHIAPFPTQIVVSPESVISKFTFGGDLFFSGHTGLPFLMALIFWQDKILRYIFIISSLVFGVVVLMGHLHYSIDVLAAFFITYAIFKISLFLFKKDREIFIK